MCNLKKIISSDITAFEPGTSASLLVEHVGSVTVVFSMISLGGRIVGSFFAHMRSNSCRRVWHVQAF